MPAAGIGERMQADLPKQYLKLARKTILEHSVDALLSESLIHSVTVCLNPQDTIFNTLSIADHPRVSTTLGGATRAQSVLNGLSALVNQAEAHDWVLVHDAARPCLSQTALRHLIDCVIEKDIGGILAIPARDTVKRSKVGQTIDKTLDRSEIWLAQTPQMFRYSELESALSSALEQNLEITDEASAMEQAGHDVLLVEGEPSNLKVTTPQDLVLAKALI